MHEGLKTAVEGSRGVLITDLDNTLYDFRQYFDAGLADLVRLLEQKFRLAPSEVLSQLRAVYSARRNVEYPFAAAELEATRELDDNARRELSRETADAFWKAGSNELSPYPTVRETLRLLEEENIAVIALSDAPYYEAQRRLAHMALLSCFSAIVAPDWFGRASRTTIRFGDLPGRERPPRGQYAWRLDKTQRKPNREVLCEILESVEDSKTPRVVVGDSYERDLAPAAELGVTCLRAAYGERPRTEDSLLLQVAPSVHPEVRGRRQPTTCDQGRIEDISAFGEVLRYLPVQQTLFLGP